jgi:hypothetical protein
MVTVNNRDLRDTFLYLTTIDKILQKEIRQVKGNKFYLDKIVPENLSKVFSQKEKTALIFTDNLEKASYDGAVLNLVSAFERVVFEKYKNSYGTLKNIVGENAVRPMDFFKSRVNFINDKIEYLAGILNLLEGHIPNDLFLKLKIIKDHRNYIAHGKRDSQPPAYEFKLDEMVRILDEVILEIED